MSRAKIIVHGIHEGKVQGHGVRLMYPDRLPDVESESTKTIGPGTCRHCGRKFKRLDMHVCKEKRDEKS